MTMAVSSYTPAARSTTKSAADGGGVAEQLDRRVGIEFGLERIDVGHPEAHAFGSAVEDERGLGLPAEHLALRRQEARVAVGHDQVDGGGGGGLGIVHRVVEPAHGGTHEVLRCGRMFGSELGGREDDTERSGHTEVERVEQLDADSGPLERADLVALPTGESDDLVRSRCGRAGRSRRAAPCRSSRPRRALRRAASPRSTAGACPSRRSSCRRGRRARSPCPT